MSVRRGEKPAEVNAVSDPGFPIEGVWLMTGCYFHIDGKWRPDIDYMYAPYYELWEFFPDGLLVHHACGIDLRYRYSISGDTLRARRICGLPETETGESDTYLVHVGQNRLTLTLLYPPCAPEESPGSPNRRFELSRYEGVSESPPAKPAA